MVPTQRITLHFLIKLNTHIPYDESYPKIFTLLLGARVGLGEGWWFNIMAFGVEKGGQDKA